jgi:hypothetical protein
MPSATTILVSLKAGKVADPRWTTLTIDVYEISVTNEPLTVDGIRQPTSMLDAIEIAKKLKALPITPIVSDARWQKAGELGTQIPGKSGLGDKGGALMNDPDQVSRWNKKFPNTGRFSDGFWKESVIVPGLKQKGKGALAQYGLRHPDGKMVQHGKPGDHDENWGDYSNTPTYMRRAAKKDGKTVDLLAELAAKGGCPLGAQIPDWLVKALKG